MKAAVGDLHSATVAAGAALPRTAATRCASSAAPSSSMWNVSACTRHSLQLILTMIARHSGGHVPAQLCGFFDTEMAGGARDSPQPWRVAAHCTLGAMCHVSSACRIACTSLQGHTLYMGCMRTRCSATML